MGDIFAGEWLRFMYPECSEFSLSDVVVLVSRRVCRDLPEFGLVVIGHPHRVLSAPFGI